MKHFSPSRMIAVARKEFLHILRDPRSLIMAIAIPMLLLLLFGYALTMDVDQVPMMVWDQSRSVASRELLSRFGGSRYFSVRDYADNYQELERAIDTRQALAALVIPEDFARCIKAGRPAALQLIVDGSDSNTATIAMGYAEMVCQNYSRQILMSYNRRAPAQLAYLPVEIRPRVWFNAELESRNYIIPGLIAVIMMVIAALLTSLTVAREWERGTMEQLISTPIKSQELILGKLLPYFVLGMFDVLLAVLMGELLFHVPLRGSVALVFAVSLIFLTGALSLGMVISIVARTQLMANQLAMVLTFLPAFLLSGFAYAIGNMPRPIQWVTYVIPARYFITILKGIYLKGVGLRVLGLDVLFLALFAFMVVAAGHWKFKKKME